MEFRGATLHTTNVPRLVDFYSKVLGLRAQGDDTHSAFAEVSLAIWNPGNIDVNKFSAERFLTLMYQVDDVDQEYERLEHADIQIEFTSQPTTQPWGVRAFGFKDPDGNNIDFLAPAE